MFDREAGAVDVFFGSHRISKVIRIPFQPLPGSASNFNAEKLIRSPIASQSMKAYPLQPQPSHPRVAAAFCIWPVQMIKKSEKGLFN